MMRPRLLDLYCCQGGCSMGYFRAGFDVSGVDISPQPRYPFPFRQADVLEVLQDRGRGFDALHASPPCQLYSRTHKIRGREHPDLIGLTRDALNATGLPWIMENVEEARPEMINPIMLCGAMFGLRTYRHRLFESGGGLVLAAPAHPAHRAPLAKMGRPVEEGQYMHVVGNFSNVPLARSEAVMGMPWASRDGLREAVPPVYTEYLGAQLMEAL